ncbi:hypothetical protein NA57DRAFT_59879 [Rhizodiscina lignyota]|uniref:Uncharacterized protein n=1 Tax=Rhizodiscina lignyota TaxID=1504668 RepID=A0A9P4IAS0_9PEZI|nr:hypothetical protein NA57DRAFT_59879 [Rhizodiscina lignyota]
MHASFFSYSLERPYPFRWFTWIVVIGGIAFTALFSVLNVATNGYNLTTLRESHWYQRAPLSWLNNLQVTCQAQNLAVGSDFHTTNLGLSHHIQNVFGAEYSNGTRDNFAAIPYLGNYLHDCQVNEIRIKMFRVDNCSGPFCSWLSWRRSTATASTTCAIEAGSSSRLNITTTWDAEPNNFDSFIQLDSREEASMWWGSVLLSMWFQSLRTQMAHSISLNDPFDWADITLGFDTSKDITSMDFITYLGSVGKNSGQLQWLNTDPNHWNFHPLSSFNNSNIQPYLPQQLDGFAKALYSTILIDFGQTQGPNVLTDPHALQYYLSSSFDVNRTTDSAGTYLVSALWLEEGVPANESFHALNTSDSMGPIGATPAQIFSQYACQVPQLKPAGTLALALIIGDLVLLQAVWKIFSWAAGWWLKRKDSHAMFCGGCLQHMKCGPYQQMRRSDEEAGESSTKCLTRTKSFSTESIQGNFYQREWQNSRSLSAETLRSWAKYG